MLAVQGIHVDKLNSTAGASPNIETRNERRVPAVVVTKPYVKTNRSLSFSKSSPGLRLKFTVVPQSAAQVHFFPSLEYIGLPSKFSRPKDPAEMREHIVIRLVGTANHVVNP